MRTIILGISWIIVIGLLQAMGFSAAASKGLAFVLAVLMGPVLFARPAGPAEKE